MELCSWEEIFGFSSRRDFEDFLIWIDEQVQAEIASEIAPPKSNAPCNSRDKWFIHNESGLVWHLIWPDITTLVGAFKIYIENFNDTWTETHISGGYDYELVAQWMNKQIQAGKAAQTSGVAYSTIRCIEFDADRIVRDGDDNGLDAQWLIMGTFVQLESGQVWRLNPPNDERGHYDGFFKRIEVVDVNEKLARLEYLFKQYLKLLKDNNGRNFVKDIKQILNLFTSHKSVEARLETIRSSYQSLLGGHGTLERFVIRHDDEVMQKGLDNYLAELMQEICNLLELKFSRLPRVEEGYPPGHPYWSIKDPKCEGKE